MKLYYDLIIIGGGPAGLSAAINAASEGLDVVVCDAAPNFGGQAGQSSLIENYAGFPEGISGKDLTKLFLAQAHKFGVDFVNPFKADKIDRNGELLLVYSDDGETMIGKSILIAIGLSYVPLPIKGLSRFMGAGVYYGSPNINESYEGQKIAIVGSANSAGQAATFLASCNTDVTMIVRGNSIEEKMSSYLSERVLGCDRINIITNTEITSVHGSPKGLESISISSIDDGLSHLEVDKLFILIGSKPKTRWVTIGAKNADEFLLVGESIPKDQWHCDRKPFPMETAPGIFVAGDVRVGSVKRVASAIGEGARVVNEVHQYLRLLKEEKQYENSK